MVYGGIGNPVSNKRINLLKLVYISNSVIPSRTANSIHVMKMCQAMAKLGHNVLLLAPAAKAQYEKTELDMFKFYGVDECFIIRKLPFWNRKFPTLLYFVSAGIYCLFIMVVLHRMKPDIAFGRFFGGCWISAFMGIRTMFESHSPIWSSRLGASFFKMMIRKKYFEKLIVISQALKDVYIESGLIEAKRIQVAHDAADATNRFDFIQNWPGRKGSLQVGYFGHFYPGRGMDLLRKIAGKMNDVDFHLVGGAEEDVHRIKEMLKKKNVYFHGFISPGDVYKYRNNCDVLIAPYQDTVSVHGSKGDTSKFMSPLKIFEYMACGKAMVISDMPVIREVLSNKTAILVPCNDPVVWKEALNSLKEVRKRERLGKSAYEDFVLKHTWKNRAKAVIKVKEKRIRVMFIAPSLFGGGAERFLTILLKHLDRGLFDPVIVLVNSDGPLVTKIPKDVEVIDFGKKRVRHAIFRIAVIVRRRHPDIVFSNIGHLNIAVMSVRALMPRSTKMIARETNIASINIVHSPLPRLLPILYRIFYPKYDKVVCQSTDMAIDLLSNLHIPKEKLVIIHNPVDAEQIAKDLQSEVSVLPKGKVNIVAAGKLKYQKGFDLLLKSVLQLRHRNFHLTILGVGPEEKSLKAMAQRLGLTHQLHC